MGLMELKYQAILIQEDKGYYAIVPELPGCYTEGDTVKETIKNLREAIELYLEAQKDIDAFKPKHKLITDVDVKIS